MKGLLNVARTFLFLALETFVRPRWAYYRTRAFYYRYYKNRFHKNRVAEYQSNIEAIDAAIALITNSTAEEVAEFGRSEILEKMRVHEEWVVAISDEDSDGDNEGPIEFFYGPSPQLMRAVHIVCRLLKPEVVIETGVAKGFTSAAMLDALERNGMGELYSIEMPSLYIGYTRQVGEKIPQSLRTRWHLELGPSAIVLPRLLKKLGSVDVFLYDSASSYDNQLGDLCTILASMRPGGVLISNLLITDAFIEATESFSCKWIAVEQTKPTPIGLIAKLD
ncbi:MAG: class I SAM-dependent methyltransferase [Gammaproteobacteria bacterium]|nr:class I SAM-dependent methyltransferase [Gammaproteobacteria bacterium]